MPLKIIIATIYIEMRHIGGSGVVDRDTKIWTNSKTIKERIDEELRKRRTGSEGMTWADDTNAKTEEYKFGRADGQARREELEDRESKSRAYVP